MFDQPTKTFVCDIQKKWVKRICMIQNISRLWDSRVKNVCGIKMKYIMWLRKSKSYVATLQIIEQKVNSQNYWDLVNQWNHYQDDSIIEIEILIPTIENDIHG